MSRALLRDHFGVDRRIVLPVVHVTSIEQASRNVELARAAGAHGAWLIDMGTSNVPLAEAYQIVRRNVPGFWLGVNFLHLPPTGALELGDRLGVPGVWSDDAGDPDVVGHLRRTLYGSTLFFGGVAFKYRPQPESLYRAGHEAKWMDVPTTSGPGTGQSASVDKVATLRAGMGDDHPLGIASGITPANVGDFLPYVDVFLVATGISRAFDELDAELTTELVSKVRLG